MKAVTATLERPTIPRKSSTQESNSANLKSPSDNGDLQPIRCENCDTLNWRGEVLCRRCGIMLISNKVLQKVITRRISREISTAEDVYLPNTTLLLRIPSQKKHIELRPQDYERDVLVGRTDEERGITPDVDLTPYNGAYLGVSRLHMALRYDPTHNRVNIKDMNSSNGVVLNGTQLSPEEIRVLRNNDRIELGWLIMQAIFIND